MFGNGILAKMAEGTVCDTLQVSCFTWRPESSTDLATIFQAARQMPQAASDEGNVYVRSIDGRGFWGAGMVLIIMEDRST